MTEHSSQQAGCQRPRWFAGQWETLLSAVLLLVVPELAQPADIPNAVLETKFRETHEPEVRVSGNIVVGVMAATAYTGLARDQLVIRPLVKKRQDKKPPVTKNRELCLKVTSRDGAYSSENQYRLDGTPPIVHLPYQSGYPEVVKSYTSEQGSLAIAATLGTCEETMEGDYYLPAEWDAKNLPARHGVTLYINGFDATDVYYQLKAGADWLDPQDCDYIEEGRHTAYNFSCNITALPENDNMPLTLNILREVYGRELQPLTIKIFAAR